MNFSLLYKRLFRRNLHHLGITTNYNLFLLHPLHRLLSKGEFISDTSDYFPNWITNLTKKSYNKAVILGNAPTLSNLSQQCFNNYKENKFLTIGLNRSIYKFQTDILLWSDLLTISDILKKRCIKSNNTVCLHAQLERDHRLAAEKDANFQFLHKFWYKNKSFKNWPKQKLFMFRNSLIAALHLCYKLQIKEVVLIGFSFDDRSYFYNTQQTNQSYEIIPDKDIIDKCGGYSTHRIVREVIEYLICDENIHISYIGNSHFLSSISMLKKATPLSI